MKLMKRETETTHVPDCFVEAYKTLGYSVVGEEEPAPTAPPLEEQEQVVEDIKDAIQDINGAEVATSVDTSTYDDWD